jgi:hypothetical protein
MNKSKKIKVMSKQEFIDKVQSKWISRKLLVFMIASVALFTGNVQSSDWVIISSIYISLEGATSIVERIMKAKTGGSQTNLNVE